MTTTKPNIRTATRAERNRARAIGFSALLIMLMLTVAITFTVLSLNQPGNENPGGEEPPPVGGPIAFGMPINGSFTILKEFSDSALQFNATMNRWQSHRAISIAATAGTEVLAPYGGVARVETTLYGTTVTITHRDGFETRFTSLAANPPVSNGERVEKGQKIGTVGTTSRVEFTNQPHVRIELRENGVRVDPAEFIDFGNK